MEYPKLHWRKRRKIPGKPIDTSISRSLKRASKISDSFEAMLSMLTLEEIIGLKFELIIKSAGGLVYGIPVLDAVEDIVREAIVRATLAGAHSKSDAARFLSVELREINYYMRKYKIGQYSNEEILDGT